MSESAKILIVGESRESLLEKLEEIKKWDNGHNYPIVVCAGEGHEITDSIENVGKAIKTDIASYIQANFPQTYTIRSIDPMITPYDYKSGKELRRERRAKERKLKNKKR